MKKNTVIIICSILLMILGTYMIYLGIKGKILPPTITGIGFFIIAFAFLGLRNNKA